MSSSAMEMNFLEKKDLFPGRIEDIIPAALLHTNKKRGKWQRFPRVFEKFLASRSAILYKGVAQEVV